MQPSGNGQAGNTGNTASTSVNISIQDKKDFPPDVAPLDELFSEFCMSDGRLLFECSGLVKTTGIDLMNCPLNVVLKLRVKRRLPPPQGSIVLWHVILPLPLISKYLLAAPHEWETWIGLLPNQHDLDAFPPDTSFTQAMHLISRPEFPKFRLKFTYRNPELQAQKQQEQEQQELMQRQQLEQLKEHGQSKFADLQAFMRGAPSPSPSPAMPPAASSAEPMVTLQMQDLPGGASDTGASSGGTGAPSVRLPPMGHSTVPVGSAIASPVTSASPVSFAMPVAVASASPMGAQQAFGYPAESERSGAAVVHVPIATPVVASPVSTADGNASAEELAALLAPLLRLTSNVRRTVEQVRGSEGGGAPLPAALVEAEVLSSTQAGLLVDMHCQQLRRCLQPAQDTVVHSGSDSAAERLIRDGLSMALLGMLEDTDGGSVATAAAPRTMTNLSAQSGDQMTSLKSRYPQLWDVLRDVSRSARERVAFVERQRQHQDRILEGELMRAELQQGSAADARKRYDKLLLQQKQNQLESFDEERNSVRRKQDELRRHIQDLEHEARDLVARLGPTSSMKQRP